MTAHESDLISDLVAPATECSLIEWAAAFNFAGDSPMSLLGTVCDTRAENRGFTPAGFSSGNPLCGAYRSEECGESGSYEHITEACYDKYAVYEAELANDRA
jgi:hypothetical protein